MIYYLLNKMLLSFKERYNYDVQYQQDMLTADFAAYLKFMGFQTMSSHTGNLPPQALHTARLRTIIKEDCGSCAQLAVNMALAAGLETDLIRAILQADINNLPEELRLVMHFTDSVLAHNSAADDLREKILARWGQRGLISIGFAISSYRVYPTLKYALGYGKACSQVIVNNTVIAPNNV